MICKYLEQHVLFHNLSKPNGSIVLVMVSHGQKTTVLQILQENLQ